MTEQQSMNLDPCQKYMDAYKIARGGDKTRALKKLIAERNKLLEAETRAATPSRKTKAAA